MAKLKKQNGGAKTIDRSCSSNLLSMESNSFDPDLIHSIFKLSVRNMKNADALECEVGAGVSTKSRLASANGNALKLSCEFLRILITEAVQRAAAIAEAEGVSKIEATHLERILPLLLLDF